MFALVYAIIGAFVAAAHKYFSHDVGTVEGAAEAVLAILLWPLVLIGIHINIK